MSRKEPGAMIAAYDLVCFCPERWDTASDRRHELLRRIAIERRVFWIEPPIYRGDRPWIEVHTASGPVHVVVPRLPADAHEDEARLMQRRLLSTLDEERGHRRFAAWYGSPSSLPSSRHLHPLATIYDCAAGEPAPAHLETELLRRAQLVLVADEPTALRHRARHANVHRLPDGWDGAAARLVQLIDLVIRGPSPAPAHWAGARVG
jgi:hypothetical protein